MRNPLSSQPPNTKYVQKRSPSGIAEISNGSLNEEAPIYNLAGQRVSKEYKGVVIQNGKKFIKK